jgi:PAS domain S-box-containing protein
MRHPHPNPLGNRQGLLGRVAPYACVALLATALIPVQGLSGGPIVVVGTVGLTVLIVTSPWWVPWARLPFWMQAIPPISYLGVIAILREADSGARSGYGSLAALVVMWLAIYGTRAELTVGIAGVGVMFGLPIFLIGEPNYPSSEIGRAVLWLAVSVIIGYTTQQLMGRVRDQAATSDEQADALGQSERRTRQILESAHEAFVSIDSAGIILAWNPQAEETFGWSQDEAIGRELAETIIPERYHEAHRKGITRFLETGEGPVLNQRLELAALHRDGHEFPVELTISPLLGSSGYRFHAFVRDITARKQSELYFEAQHEVTRVLAESGPGENAMPKVLEALAERMGWEVGEFWALDETAHVLRRVESWHVPSIDVSALDRATENGSFERGAGIPGEVWARQAPVRIGNIVEGPHFLHSSAAVEQGLRAAVGLPIKSESRFLGVMVFFSREIKALDAELAELMSALSGQVGQYLERRRAEREADRAKDEFFSLVSHEFRTPLTSIAGYTELLLEQNSELNDAQRAQFLEVVQRNSKRLRRLVDDLLFISKVQAGKFSLSPRELDLRDLVIECVEGVAPHAKDNGLELVIEVDSIPQVVGDPDRLGQLLDNLLTNAVKYTPAGERVGVRLYSEGGTTVTEVTNTGVFIPEEERGRLFERFYRRSDASEREPAGVGLGLSIAESIARAHGGSIGVRSSRETGTMFRVELPFDGPAGAPDAPGRQQVAA